MARETWKRAGNAGPGLTLLLALLASAAHGQETPCPDSQPDEADAAAAPGPTPEELAEQAKQPISIEADDDNYEVDVNGNARVCGNVEFRQGQRVIRTDCLEYNAQTEKAKMEGGVEYSDPTLVVRGGNGSYSPATGAQIEGAQFELKERNARGSATNLRVDGQRKVTLSRAFRSPPARPTTWPGSCARRASNWTPKPATARAGGPASASRTCRSSTCRTSAFPSARSARAASCSRSRATPRAAARSCRCLTTGTCGRTWTC